MKTFIANRSGVNPTLDETESVMLKVYANEAAIDADLANLEVGQVVAAKEESASKVEVDKQWVRNQNRLSALESVTLSASSADPTVMDYDGFLVISCSLTSTNGTAQSHLYVNGTDFTSTSISQYAIQRSDLMTIPVNKGDEVYVSAASAYTALGMFFKQRDYSDRS